MTDSNTIEKLIIIGSGPAGHTAAIYAGRAQLNPLIFEGLMAAGVPAGGQLTITTDVENYPGFPDGISGPELMDRMRRQSLRWGARILTETVNAVDLSRSPFLVTAGGRSYHSRSLIIATGAAAKRLHVPGEDRLWQKGVSACAVCDGALPIYRNKILFVIGGGDSAAEEALYLTKFASKVYVVHRRDELRASKVMQDRLFAHPKIEILYSHTLVEIKGDERVSHVRLKDLKTGTEKDWEAGGVFYAIGHQPNTDFLKGQLDLDDSGYIITEKGSTRTSRPGVFAAGDVQDKVYRQAVTAAGSGCMAALDAERYLASLE